MERKELIQLGINDLNNQINKREKKRKDLQGSSLPGSEIKVEALDEEIKTYKKLLEKFENDEVSIMTRDKFPFIPDTNDFFYLYGSIKGYKLENPNHVYFYYNPPK